MTLYNSIKIASVGCISETSYISLNLMKHSVHDTTFIHPTLAFTAYGARERGKKDSTVMKMWDHQLDNIFCSCFLGLRKRIF